MNTCFNLGDGCNNSATTEFCPECLANGGIHKSKLSKVVTNKRSFVPPWLVALTLVFSYHILKGVFTEAYIPWTGMFFAWLVVITYRVWKLEKNNRKG